MRNILIMGYNSYIGTAVANALCKYDDYKVSQFDILGIDPEIVNFGAYDIVIQAAGIEPSKNADKYPRSYFEINRDLAYHSAYVAKAYGVKQFIVLSSIDVYGTKQEKVTSSSMPLPETDYAKSKYEADEKIAALENDDFRVCIVRLPIVYGDKHFSLFKSIGSLFSSRFTNRRTEKIHIDQVCSLIERLVANCERGIFIAE